MKTLDLNVQHGGLKEFSGPGMGQPHGKCPGPFVFAGTVAVAAGRPQATALLPLLGAAPAVVVIDHGGGQLLSAQIR